VQRSVSHILEFVVCLFTLFFSESYITEKCPIASEMYFSIVLGRVSGGPVLVASKHGGMNIEEVAATDPASVV
jgi:succinyl-CoA synthetase beta subunit